MSNFKNLQFKTTNSSNGIRNKENFIKTPSENKKNKKETIIEDTPTPVIKKKVLRLTSNQNNLNPFNKKVLDTPTDVSTKRSNVSSFFVSL
jgi:hypothetical protein